MTGGVGSRKPIDNLKGVLKELIRNQPRPTPAPLGSGQTRWEPRDIAGLYLFRSFTLWLKDSEFAVHERIAIAHERQAVL